MRNITVLLGGTNGYGIDEAGIMLCRIFSHLGYHIYMYNDFPSVIKGQHQFVVVRASLEKVSAHSDQPDVVMAFGQDAIDRHKESFSEKTIILYDSETVAAEGLVQAAAGLPVGRILKEEGAKPAMGIYCMAGALCRILKVKWEIYEDIIRKHYPDMLELKIRIARTAFNLMQERMPVAGVERPVLPVLNGCQAISMGLLKAGLRAYIAYPMTPTSPILELMASLEPELGLQVVLPESEIAVIMMSSGYSYMGVKNAVGTSGGGFSLMAEGLGMSAMSELPVVVVLGQRAGPSTGMPTYTAQTDLHFALNAGHGEMPRLVVAPGDAEEAYYWSGLAMNKAWKYQIPAIVLTDKTLGLGVFSFDISLAGELSDEQPVLWDGEGEYKRYSNTESGISPLAFAPTKEQVIKTNSYIHDEYGLASESPDHAKGYADKMMLKERNLGKELEDYEQVKVYNSGQTALLCWGSNKGVCLEIARKYGFKMIQMLVLSPFPQKDLTQALQGVDKLVSVECNARGQLAMLLKQYGFAVDEIILKYDGRPFSLEDLEKEVEKVIE
ncbi:2-oxoacid:acceptor oxidoreductase subunit alpha [Parasporobacterium paucivorans]|uniref:2-oxoglutarate ferredoxin oxidoreductase subunit alpha n=1 Tax=Parasporobacterium paucivorans DSM 15970 TaxID=1122934 RepID=A0A1M6IYM2_9FIRM|nr:2-oxoacid:acceptor oxidoreductase subunit alpha [Parasporobacterium paucivorans]SHJ39578.1 2-oxoglutarate ferredoxin oxidoreductase subunit alpha [Parasporobacterium paucivorans DSM 15970]